MYLLCKALSTNRNKRYINVLYYYIIKHRKHYAKISWEKRRDVSENDLLAKSVVHGINNKFFELRFY